MKRSLRDWLLARHADDSAALDALRRAAVPPARVSLRELWRELFVRPRVAWAVIAGVWIAIVAVNVLQQRRASSLGNPSLSPEALVAWREQQRQLDALFSEDRALP